MRYEYWVTWQCSDNQDGDYFLTGVPFDTYGLDLSRDQIVKELMRIALYIEGVESGSKYEIASILRTDSRECVHVVY